MRWALSGLSLTTAVGVAAAAWFATRSAPPPQPATFPVVLPESVSVNTGAGRKLAISPDGSALVISGQRVGGASALYLRRLADPIATLIQGTDNGGAPTFSPDGQWLLFRTTAAGANRLMRVPVTGGTAQVVSDSASSASWGDGDVVVVEVGRTSALASSGRLYRTTPTGGAWRLLARPDTARKRYRFRFPHVLPGGTHALLALDGSPPTSASCGWVWCRCRMGR